MSWQDQPTGPDVQNFSISAGNLFEVTFDFSGVTGLDSLDGYTVYWSAYEETVGVPLAGVSAVITKSSLSGGGIELLDSPSTSCVMTLSGIDTVGLLRNYYHEASIVDAGGNQITPTTGIMTVLGTENRE
jgi:hypothetical protein